jgi:hypothetical protein
MGPGLLADVDRAAGHLVIVGGLVGIAILAGLIYKIVQLVVQRRARRARRAHADLGTDEMESGDGLASQRGAQDARGLER